MKNKILVKSNYLMIPIAKEKECKTISFFIDEEKIYEFSIPISDAHENNYTYQYMAPIPMESYLGMYIKIEGDYNDSFFNEITQLNNITDAIEQHPILHFAANTGWINDPNGLIYQDGIYHLYFQYNPFNTLWENMCWGHAVSTDMLHWEQKDTVLYPDKDGPIFSGSGIVNEKALLGLPKDAYIFFYTAAGGKSDWSKGKLCTQNIAFSTDGGNTLHKKDNCIIEHICHENRDPKVYWHEQSKAYFMVLFLKDYDYAIFRSIDLLNWERTQTLTLDRAWECPDFIEIPIVGGGTKWMFWSADGFYFLGDFDGYTFQTDGIRREAYKTKISYAAQTFWGLKDRIVSIPWLQTINKNKNYTGIMGIPRELVLVESNHDLILSQLPIREFNQQKELQITISIKNETVVYDQKEKAVVEIQSDLSKITKIEWSIFNNLIQYNSNSGIITVAGKETMLGTDIKEMSIIVDSEIIELTANEGTIYAVYELETDNQKGIISSTAEGYGEINIYQLK